MKGPKNIAELLKTNPTSYRVKPDGTFDTVHKNTILGRRDRIIFKNASGELMQVSSAKEGGTDLINYEPAVINTKNRRLVESTTKLPTAVKKVDLSEVKSSAISKQSSAKNTTKVTAKQPKFSKEVEAERLTKEITEKVRAKSPNYSKPQPLSSSPEKSFDTSNLSALKEGVKSSNIPGEDYSVLSPSSAPEPVNLRDLPYSKPVPLNQGVATPGAPQRVFNFEPPPAPVTIPDIPTPAALPNTPASFEPALPAVEPMPNLAPPVETLAKAAPSIKAAAGALNKIPATALLQQEVLEALPNIAEGLSSAYNRGADMGGLVDPAIAAQYNAGLRQPMKQALYDAGYDVAGNFYNLATGPKNEINQNLGNLISSLGGLPGHLSVAADQQAQNIMRSPADTIFNPFIQTLGQIANNISQVQHSRTAQGMIENPVAGIINTLTPGMGEISGAISPPMQRVNESVISPTHEQKMNQGAGVWGPRAVEIMEGKDASNRSQLGRNHMLVNHTQAPEPSSQDFVNLVKSAAKHTADPSMNAVSYGFMGENKAKLKPEEAAVARHIIKDKSKTVSQKVEDVSNSNFQPALKTKIVSSILSHQGNNEPIVAIKGKNNSIDIVHFPDVKAKREFKRTVAVASHPEKRKAVVESLLNSLNPLEVAKRTANELNSLNTKKSK